MKTLLKNACIYTPQGVIRDGFVAVDGTMIAAVGAARPEGDFDREKDMSGKLLLPGLVNAHTHAAMTLLRGVGTDLPLQRWLFDSVFPVEARLTGEDIRIGTALALLEMLACGTTSLTDMYFFPWETAKLVADSGIKANLCYPVRLVSDLKRKHPETIADVHIMVTDPAAYIDKLADAGADYVTELISQLPEAAAVTYASYQKIAGAAAAARSALDALSKDQQTKVDVSKLEKLEKLEDAIKGFRAIDDVRAQIDALPDADRLTTAEREAAKSAQKAYNALTAGQRDYLTGAQLEKIAAIATALTAMDAKHSSGSGSAYTGGHTFTTDLEPGSITGVFVDGKKLDSRYYTVSGSDVTLTADYLKTLRSGKHTVKIENATKVATGSFTLSGSGAVQSSRTGDPGVAIYFAMGAVSFLGSAAWLRKRKET